MRTPLYTPWKVLQYPVAFIVAMITSFVSAFILLLLEVPFLALHAAVGFLGVFAGGVVFLPDSRRIGAVCLALVGVAFFFLRFVWYDVGGASVPDGWLRLALVFAGAALAVASHFVLHSLCRK